MKMTNDISIELLNESTSVSTSDLLKIAYHLYFSDYKYFLYLVENGNINATNVSKEGMLIIDQLVNGTLAEFDLDLYSAAVNLAYVHFIQVHKEFQELQKLEEQK